MPPYTEKDGVVGAKMSQSDYVLTFKKYISIFLLMNLCLSYVFKFFL